MTKQLLLGIMLLINLSLPGLADGECHYKTETVTENGVVKTVKEIKVCSETQKIEMGFWNSLMHTKEGNELFWNVIVAIFTLKGGN